MAELKTKSGESVPLSDESGLILGLRAVAAPLTKEHIHLAAIQYVGSSPFLTLRMIFAF
ncbi:MULTISPECIES: hypothetical protein [Vibrio]|uniref:hypothetical protein n=1 Tax=Vibrio TaxID=662 RepID=UPI0013F17853|nr:hypothetical protein [Vibrio parahaemolyticus]MBE3687267.1 hypothetical protein [Vibrio parahaemolyticus]MBE3803928.1 hypothetical protein [Vibrio parahaemolyticus]MBE3808234.1 hypothetical protein [Vibrio parahaemolyticus]MBE4230086.1 hypothetical protein [Vibrio parahaemolyticus]MBE4392413.1 hypothetical protein [Vibrio parahaemolyticus]